jgi:hypothetical protein
MSLKQSLNQKLFYKTREIKLQIHTDDKKLYIHLE